MRSISLFLLICIFGLSGCVTGTRTIDLATPEYSTEKKSQGTIYIKEIQDLRTFEQKPRSPSTPSVKGKLESTSPEQLSTLIGRQRNGYGKAMGDVALPEGESVQQKVRELITKGLESRGYTVVDDENAEYKIFVDINKFWAWFTPGMWSVSFESNLECKIDFEHEATTQTLLIEGYGRNKGQVASNANWQLAYKRAYLNFLENLDKELDAQGL